MRKMILVACFLVLALCACGSETGTTSSPQTPAVATSVPTATATPKPTQPPKWTTVQKFSGNGTKKTAIFAVPDDWKILYSCTGGDFEGFLAVTVYDSQNTYIDGAIRASCLAGSTATTGETEEHQAGNVYLSVDATGDWSLQVQVLK